MCVSVAVGLGVNRAGGDSVAAIVRSSVGSCSDCDSLAGNNTESAIKTITKNIITVNCFILFSLILTSGVIVNRFNDNVGIG